MVRRICGRLCCVAGCLNSGAGPGWRRLAGLRQSAVAAVRVVWARFNGGGGIRNIGLYRVDPTSFLRSKI